MAEWINTPLIVTAALAVITAVFTVIWKTATWKAKVDSDRSTFKSTLESFIKEIRDDIKGILSRLPSTPAPVGSGSPLRLTDFGERIAKHFGADNWASELAPTLVDDIRGMQPYSFRARFYEGPLFLIDSNAAHQSAGGRAL